MQICPKKLRIDKCCQTGSIRGMEQVIWEVLCSVEILKQSADSAKLMKSGRTSRIGRGNSGCKDEKTSSAQARARGKHEKRLRADEVPSCGVLLLK